MSTNGQYQHAIPQEQFLSPDSEAPNLLAILARRKWIVVCCVLIAGAFGVLYFFKSAPVYESASQILVRQTTPMMIQADPRSPYTVQSSTALASQCLLIQSPLVVGAAVNGSIPDAGLSQDLVKRIESETGIPLRSQTPAQNPAVESLRDLPSLAPGTDGNAPDPVGVVMRNLSVEILKDSDVVELKYRGPRPDDCPKILQSVVRSYQQYLEQSRNSTTRAAVALFDKARNELSSDLGKLERDYADFRRTNSHLLLGNDEGHNIYQARAQKIEETRSELLIQRSQLTAQLQSLEDALTKGTDPAALLMLVEQQVDSVTPGGNAAQKELQQAETKVKQLDQQIAFVDKKLELLDQLESELEKDMDGSEAGPDAREAQLLPLLQEEQRLLERYGENHPDVISVRKRIELTRSLLGETQRDQQLAQLVQERTTLTDQRTQLLGERQLAVEELARLRSDFTRQNSQQDRSASRLLRTLGPEQSSVREASEFFGSVQPTALTRIDESTADVAGPEPSTTDATEKPRRDTFTIYLTSLGQRIAQLDRQSQQLDRLFQNEQTQIKGLDELEVADATFQRTIARKQQMFDVVIARLEELNLANDMGGYEATVVSPAAGALQVAPDLVRSLAVALALGFMAGFGLAYMVDLADRRFRSPEDVQRYLGIPLLGHVPMAMPKDLTPKKESKIDPMVAVHHKPRSSLAETFRSIRTALFFSPGGKDAKVIQITSPSPRDGKTTLSSNMAVTLAQSGKKVLLIDADLRKPRVHKLFPVSREVGLKNLIRGTATLQEAIQPCEVDNLLLITAGPRSRNPAELLASRNFPELIEQLRQDTNFDCIIIDTPPVLAVSDSATVAPHVDAILLVLHVHSKWSRELATRAVEVLNTVEAPLAGVVVNGVGGKLDYGYRSYRDRYRSAYRYAGYKYQYRYNYYGYRYAPYGSGYGDPDYVDTDTEGEAEAQEKETEVTKGNGRLSVE